MEQHIIDSVRALRAELNTLAECSGEEKRTKARLMEYLRENTSLRLDDRGDWFCAVHEEPGASETVAFRADMDALPFESGASHLCGHDGHSAVLAGLGLLLENRKLDRNVVLLFQHAEETGEGGKVCCRAMPSYSVSRIYAFHNIPGWAESSVLLRHGTFACASRGMTISFTGAPSHAAYPENGRNPGFAAARLISLLPELISGAGRRGMAMATLIGSEIGSKAFGSSAGSAEVWLTLRSWYDDDMSSLISAIEETACMQASLDGVEASFSFCDQFPATINDSSALGRVREICLKSGLAWIDVPEPFRWSEDFGYYGAHTKAVMVGIGAGAQWPQLHTKSYVFNDRIIPAALTLFSALAEEG